MLYFQNLTKGEVIEEVRGLRRWGGRGGGGGGDWRTPKGRTIPDEDR